MIAICKGQLEMSCGALSAIRTLGRLGLDVLCICSACLPETKTDLQRSRVSVEQVYPQDPCPRGTVAKMRHYHSFRRRAWRIIEGEDGGTLIWVAKIDSAMALGRRLLRTRYILTLQELHDKYFLYQKAIGLYASHASVVVVPEYCRANILRCWHGLNKSPFVLPNKPILESRQKRLPVSDANAAKILSSIPEGQRIILYQGVLAPDRDLSAVARAASEIGNDYRLVIMGKDRSSDLARLQEICPDLVHIPWVRPPGHLEVTSHAHIGIAFYKFDALNSIFCAPNKIWEYAGFGIPILCQDVPGLRFTVGIAEAGVCVDAGHPEPIIAGITEIERRYSQYSQRASEFYDSIDTEDLISKLIEGI